MTTYNHPSRRITTLTSTEQQGDDDGDGQRRLSRTQIDLAGVPGSDAGPSLHRLSGAFRWSHATYP
ncbi:MAG: hypothetical protein ACFE8O_09930 [Candidatus Hermodarchaeota archaeon]